MIQQLRTALREAPTRVTRQLSVLSFLLVLVLTGQGLWFLHVTSSNQWAREAQLITTALVAEAEVSFDVAASVVGPQMAPEAGAQAIRALGPLVSFRIVEPTDDDAVSHQLRALGPMPLYRNGRGPTDAKLGNITLSDGSRAYVVWRDAEQTGNRVAVLFPEAHFAAVAARLHAGYAAEAGGLSVRLVAGLSGHEAPTEQKWWEREVLRQQPLERVNLATEVHLSRRLIADAWNRQTGPLFAVVLIGTALLVLSLITLAGVAAQVEKGDAELKDVRTLALAASRSRKALLAAVSHELGLPVSGIIGTARMLQLDMQRTDAARLLSVLLMSARNLQAVIRDIVHRAMLDSTEALPGPAPANPSAIGVEVVDLFYAAAVSRGLDLTYVPPPQPMIALVDAFNLRQVLASLVGNAVKYTQKGSVTVACTMTEDGFKANHVKVRFEVRDTGPGIDNHQLKNIFTPELGTDPNAYQGSTRIGLALARRLVRGMDGELAVDSRPGRGSCFWFELSLPCAQTTSVHLSPKDFDKPAEATHCPKPAASAVSSDARILVVEDNPLSAMVTELQLRSLGYRCDVTPDGEGALAAMAAGGYDIVLMDCSLPGLSGVDVTKHWREFESKLGSKALPIVALTAKSMDIHMQQCLDVGMSDFLTKPSSPETLALTIEKWVKHSRMRAGNR